MIGFLWSCKRTHCCAAAKCSEVCIFCECCFNVINRNVRSSVAAEGEQDHGVFLAQLRSGAAPPCSLTTSVMSLVFHAHIHFCWSRTPDRCTGSIAYLHMHHQHGPASTLLCALSTCPSTPGLFNYVGSPPFNPFLALSLKMERPCSLSWKKKKCYMPWQCWQTFGIALCD